jgi:hypothetical protein
MRQTICIRAVTAETITTSELAAALITETASHTGYTCREFREKSDFALGQSPEAIALMKTGP